MCLNFAVIPDTFSSLFTCYIVHTVVSGCHAVLALWVLYTLYTASYEVMLRLWNTSKRGHSKFLQAFSSNFLLLCFSCTLVCTTLRHEPEIPVIHQKNKMQTLKTFFRTTVSGWTSKALLKTPSIFAKPQVFVTVFLESAGISLFLLPSNMKYFMPLEYKM